MKSRVLLWFVIIAASLTAYFELNPATRTLQTEEVVKADEIEYVENESIIESLNSTQGRSAAAQEIATEAESIENAALPSGVVDHALLSPLEQQSIEAAVYDLISGSDMPTSGYVSEFSCESHACSTAIHLTTTSNLMSNSAEVMANLNTALLSTEATKDFQVGLVSIAGNDTGEGVIRLVTMERRPPKYKVSVDEATGAITFAPNEDTGDDSEPR